MIQKNRLRQRYMVAAAVLLAVVTAVSARPAQAYTRTSPEVQNLIQKGLGYLEKQVHPELGGECLIALAFLKNDYEDSHPKIVAAVNACKKVIADKDTGLKNYPTVYNQAIALIFLCELDPQKYRPEINVLLDHLLKRQKSSGAWGYENEQVGDTSQTQYGVLGIWTAHHVGIPVPVSAVERVGNWLMRTQDVNGSFVYKPNDPGGSNFTRVQQGGGTLSTTAAGLGSVFVVADLVGLTSQAQVAPDDGLPPALRRVEQPEPEARGLKGANVNTAALMRALGDGNRFVAQNFRVNLNEWTYYYLYGLERYQSFRELSERSTVKEPKWYNDGVVFLSKQQQADGSWPPENSDPDSNTAFAVLFLTRSTQKSIEKSLGEGILRGGRGLPTNTSMVRVEGGRVVSTPETKTVDQLLSMLDDPKSAELGNLAEYPEQITLGISGPIREDHLARLRRLVSHESYEARIVAVRALAQARDLNNVPVLIYALGDPDLRVVREARDGLRFVSRKFEGGPPDQPSRSECQAAQAAWKQWYLSIRPNAEFLD